MHLTCDNYQLVAPMTKEKHVWCMTPEYRFHLVYAIKFGKKVTVIKFPLLKFATFMGHEDIEDIAHNAMMLMTHNSVMCLLLKGKSYK